MADSGDLFTFQWPNHSLYANIGLFKFKVLKLFEKEKVELKTSQLSDVVEMFEKEDQLEEEEDQAEETAEAKKDDKEETGKVVKESEVAHPSTKKPDGI